MYKVTENDPAILIDWNYNVLEQFVEAANKCIVKQDEAYFISTAPGKMTVTSLLEDMLNLLSTVSGGRNINSLLAPNTLSQYGNIAVILTHIELNHWVQQLFVEFIPVGSSFATFSYITNRRTAYATKVGFRALREARQVFR